MIQEQKEKKDPMKTYCTKKGKALNRKKEHKHGALLGG